MKHNSYYWSIVAMEDFRYERSFIFFFASEYAFIKQYEYAAYRNHEKELKAKKQFMYL